MVGLFDIFPFYVAAACVGVVWAMRPFYGTIWRWVATVGVGIAAWLVCVFLLNCLGQFLDSRTKRKLKVLSLDDLDKRLKEPTTVELNFILLEIRNRGVGITSYFAYLLDLLGDDQCPRRLFAFKAVHAAFPDEFRQLRSEGYTPYEPVDKCRMKVASMKTEEDVQPGDPSNPHSPSAQGVGGR